MNRKDRTQPDYLVVGEILRPHGVRGELRMRIVTDYPERLHELKKLFLAHVGLICRPTKSSHFIPFRIEDQVDRH